MDLKFTFVNANRKKYVGFDGKEMQEMLLKWSMKGRLNIQTYCFNEPFHTYHKNEFIQAFFNDKLVASTLLNVTPTNEWVSVGVTAESVDIEKILCSVTSMDFFDRLKGPGKVASSNGNLKRCLGELIGDFEVWDELRRMLLDEDSDHRELFSKNEKNEFIFRIFFHLCLGGRLCQYEDNLEPYLNATKLLYKDLISVAKDPETKKLTPTSMVFKVVAKMKNGLSYFPRDVEHPQNFCYFVIEPLTRVVTIIIHQFGSSL